MSCRAAVSVISTTRRGAICGVERTAEMSARSQDWSEAVRPEMLMASVVSGASRRSSTAMSSTWRSSARAHAELLDHRDERAGRNDVALLVAHAEQGFVLHHLMGVGADDRLIHEQQPMIAHRLLHLGADIHGMAMQQPLLLGDPIGVEAGAAVALGIVQRELGLGHHVIGGVDQAGEQHAADRGR